MFYSFELLKKIYIKYKMRKIEMFFMNKNTIYYNNKMEKSTPPLPSNMQISGRSYIPTETFNMGALMAIKNTSCRSCGH